MRDALTLLKEVLTSFFIKKNDEDVLACLADQVVIFGLHGMETLKGQEELREYLSSPIAKSFQAMEMVFAEENAISSSTACLHITLTYKGESTRLSASGVVDGKDGSEKLSFMHYSLVDYEQAQELLYKFNRDKKQVAYDQKFNQAIMRKMQGVLCTYALNMEQRKPEIIDARYPQESGNQPDNINQRPIVRDQDKEYFWNCLHQAVKEDVITTFSFRSTEGKWVNGTCSSLGQKDGRYLVRVLFTPVSILYDLQLQTLEMDNIAIYVIDRETEELYYANSAAFRFFNMHPCNLTGATCHQVFWKSQERCSWCFLNQAERQEDNNLFKSPSGKILYVSVSNKIWNGRPIAVTYARDVTKLEETKEELQKANAEMQNLLDNIPTAVCLYEWDGQELHRRLVGRGYEKLCGPVDTVNIDNYQKKSEMMVHSEDLPKIRSWFASFLQGKEDKTGTQRYRIWNDKKKEYVWIEANGKLVHQEDGTALLYSVYHDETEQMELRQQLEKEKHVIEDLFANLPGGSVLFHWDGNKLQPIYVTAGCNELFGEDAYAALNRTVGLDFDFVHPDDLPLLKKFIEDNITKDNRFRSHRYRGWNGRLQKYFWVQIIANIKTNPDGTSFAYVNYSNVDAEINAVTELKKEESMLENSCRLGNIYSFRYNIKEKRAYFSKQIQEDYHLPTYLENFPEDSFTSYLVPPSSMDAYREMLRKVRQGEDATTEIEVKGPTGALTYVRFKWFVTNKENGEILEATGMSFDISQEIAERNRFARERQKILGGEKKLTAYCIMDLETGTVLEAKDFYLGTGAADGDTYQEFVAKATAVIFRKKDRERFKEDFNPKAVIRKYEDGIVDWNSDMLWSNKKGHIRWQRTVHSIITNSYTGKKYLYSYLYDVMEDKMVQALFAGMQDKFFYTTGLFSFLTKQLYTYEGSYPDRHLHIEDYNKKRAEYLQSEVLPEDLALVEQMTDIDFVQKEVSAKNDDFFFVHRKMQDGKMLYRQIRFAKVPGEVDIYILVIRDITELIEESEQKNAQLQKALITANVASRAKSEFLSRMSHEIRTPMNAIMGMTEIALDNRSDFLQVADCLSKIDTSSKYLLTLINDILEMSRIESGRTKLAHDRFQFEELITQIRTVVEPLAKKSEIRLDISNDTANGSYYGDHIRIQQVMINLLGNAMKFTKAMGRVHFGVTTVENTDTTTTFEFIVEDTGIGMSEEFMEKMYEPFSQEDSTTTSKYGGSGLGLAISRSLIQAMGGTITAESMVGIGTNFIVRIPLQKAGSVAPVHQETTNALSESRVETILKGRTVLMAEDHPLNVMVAKKLLERKGIILTIVPNGEMAVEAFNASKINEFEAVLMDIRMPVMDGLEAARQIRALDRPDAKEIPIIAMTANALDEDRQKSREAGMNAHLSKPIVPKELYQVLAKQIEGRKL